MLTQWDLAGASTYEVFKLHEGAIYLGIRSWGGRKRLPKLKFSAKISHRFTRDFTNRPTDKKFENDCYIM